MEKPLQILLTTDYSDAVMNAERYAVKMAFETGSALRFLHVYQPIIADQTGSFDASKVNVNLPLYELKKLKEHALKVVRACGCQPEKLKYECLVREGTAAGQVLEEADETMPDLIVMGTHGITGFRDFVMGTHTWQVIKKAGIPVLALPADVNYGGIKKIVFATEYREGELPVINYITRLADMFKAEVTVLHITANVITQEYEKKLSLEFTNELHNKVAYPGIELKVEHATEIVSGLEEYAKQHKTDLLIMSHQKPYFLERIFSPNSSTAKKMSLYTDLPLLIIPDYYNPDFAWFWKLFALDYSLDEDI